MSADHTADAADQAKSDAADETAGYRDVVDDGETLDADDPNAAADDSDNCRRDNIGAEVADDEQVTAAGADIDQGRDV